MSTQQADKRTASQRIDDMERGLMALYQTADNMARDLMTIKEAIKLLGNKLDSVVKVSASGQPMNDETIAKIMVENNVEELRQKVQNLVDSGALVAAEAISANSFVVGREVDSESGAVQNPRLQFVVSALQPEIKDKFPGAKVGEKIALQEGKWSFEVLEVYDIQTPTPAPQEAAEQASDSTQAES